MSSILSSKYAFNFVGNCKSSFWQATKATENVICNLPINKKALGVPGGSVVKNLPADAGDMGSTPGPGRSRIPRSSYARAPQLPSLCCTAHVPQRLKPVGLEPVLRNRKSHRNEKPTHCS